MRTLTPETEPLAIAVEFLADALRITLEDGRKLSVPLTWFPRLLHATAEQRENWEFVGPGRGAHWEELDEDISVAGLRAGRGNQTRRPPEAAGSPRSSAKK